ncbi:hypothetical protein HanRHA438_Chr09g0381221 [Helianthus annuus]|nr:hypothetical protein HanIR_Chr09g0398831 [Helianthus annuus]KAJ0886591.1 hypothetical protein HanRHA438_Chr09g0381221 [Helianthus annuus]
MLHRNQARETSVEATWQHYRIACSNLQLTVELDVDWRPALQRLLIDPRLS